MKNHYLITAVIAVLVGVGCFFGGMQYQKSKTPSFAQFGNGNRQFGQNGQRTNGDNQARFGNRGNIQRVSGEIISADENSVTVKLEDGSTKIIILADSATINKTSEASKDELQTGETVNIFGTSNSDGSVTAQTVSLGNDQQFPSFRPPEDGTTSTEQEPANQ